MTKSIPLTQGKFALVDDEDYEWLNQWEWYYLNNAYAARDRTHIFMHRIIAGTPDGMFTDHINGDKLDNRRCNLRICSRGENVHNRPRRNDNSSGYKGVKWHKNRWRADISLDGRRHFLGTFRDPKDAARAYDEAAVRFHGEFAYLNNVLPDNIDADRYEIARRLR